MTEMHHIAVLWFCLHLHAKIETILTDRMSSVLFFTQSLVTIQELVYVHLSVSQ